MKSSLLSHSRQNGLITSNPNVEGHLIGLQTTSPDSEQKQKLLQPS